MAKETLTTEQAKAAAKEQLAKAMRDLCYATRLRDCLWSEGVGFHHEDSLGMKMLKTWTLKI